MIGLRHLCQTTAFTPGTPPWGFRPVLGLALLLAAPGRSWAHHGSSGSAGSWLWLPLMLLALALVAVLAVAALLRE